MTGPRAAEAVSGRPVAGVPTAFWLLPCTDDAHWLQEFIRGLAQRHGSPVFEPHVTLHVGECPQGVDPGGPIDVVARLWAALKLAAGATGESDAYYRSLFIDIADDCSDGLPLGRLRMQLVLALQDAGSGVRGEAGRSDKPRTAAADLDHALASYEFRPHLSLLYGNLPQPLRAELARQNDFRGRCITFDRIAAVRPAAGRPDLSEVAGWEVFGHRRLSAVCSPPPRTRPAGP